MSLSDRAHWVNNSEPHLIADVVMHETTDGGRRLDALPGWGCPCMADPEEKVGYDAWPILGETPLRPGDRRRLGFVFLSEEGRKTMKAARRFFLWEGRIIGEATVVDGESLAEVFTT